MYSFIWQKKKKTITFLFFIAHAWLECELYFFLQIERQNNTKIVSNYHGIMKSFYRDPKNRIAVVYSVRGNFHTDCLIIGQYRRIFDLLNDVHLHSLFRKYKHTHYTFLLFEICTIFVYWFASTPDVTHENIVFLNRSR